MKTRLRDFQFEVKIGPIASIFDGNTGHRYTNMTGSHLMRCFGISPWVLKDVYNSADMSLRLLNYKQLQVSSYGRFYTYNRKQSNYPLNVEGKVLFDGDTILAPWEVFNFENVTLEETNLKPADVDDDLPSDLIEKVYHLETDDFECYCTKDEVLD